MAQVPSWLWVCGPWGPSIARRPCPQRVPVVCMGFGPCTVSIFPSPAMATLAGQASLFCSFAVLTLTLVATLCTLLLSPNYYLNIVNTCHEV